MSYYEVGDRPSISSTFTSGGTLTDPTTLTFTYRTPAGVETTWVYGTNPEIVRSSLGVYTLELPLTEAGRWDYKWTATGTVAAVDRGSLLAATASLSTEQITTLSEVEAILARGRATGDSDPYTNGQKNAAIDVASKAFEVECGVAFTPRTRTITLSGDGSTSLALPDPMIRTLTSVTDEDGDALSLTNTRLDKWGGVLHREEGWPAGEMNLTVVYTHGYPEPPKDVSRAVALVASAMIADGPWDDRGYGVTEAGGLVRLLTAGVSGASFSIPEVQATLARYRFPRVA